MKLVLKNGKEFETTETSMIESITIKVNSFAEIDDIAKEFNEENLNKVQLGELTYNFIIPVRTKVEKVGETIYLTFENRQITKLENIEEELTDTQKSVAELTKIVLEMMKGE